MNGRRFSCESLLSSFLRLGTTQQPNLEQNYDNDGPPVGCIGGLGRRGRRRRCASAVDVSEAANDEFLVVVMRSKNDKGRDELDNEDGRPFFFGGTRSVDTLSEFSEQGTERGTCVCVRLMHKHDLLALLC